MRTTSAFMLCLAFFGFGTVACGPSVDQGSHPMVDADAAVDTAPSCPPGMTLCDDVCTNVRIDRDNCGACGTICADGQTCGRGVCTGSNVTPTPVTCTAPAANCDGNDANGCETNLTTDNANCGACGTRCNAGYACSSGRCQAVTPTGPVCGNNRCESGESCGTCAADCGACAPTCSAGTANCDGNAANGCEVNTNLDPNNCGTCGTRCTGVCMSGTCVNPPTGPRCGDRACNGTETCSSCAIDCGACAPTCAAGTANCDGNAANGCETILATDRLNCGMCAIHCSSTETCTAGRCVPTCTAGTTSCSGICRDLQTDPANCGSCGTRCLSGSTCSGGVCSTPTCGSSGMTYCSGTCVDTNTDNRNCGACGAVCDNGAGYFCNGSGRCRAMATMYDTYMVRVMAPAGDPARQIVISQMEDGFSPITSAACTLRDELTTTGTLTGHECQLVIRNGQTAAFNANFRFASVRAGRLDVTIDTCYQDSRYSPYDTYGSIWVYKLVGGSWVLVSHRAIDNGSMSSTAGQGCNEWDPATPCPSRMHLSGGTCTF